MAIDKTFEKSYLFFRAYIFYKETFGGTVMPKKMVFMLLSFFCCNCVLQSMPVQEPEKRKIKTGKKRNSSSQKNKNESPRKRKDSGSHMDF